MLVFGSEMHLLTLIFLILELMMLAVQSWIYYIWPRDQGRLWYLILLFLLIIYNVTGGLFPDPNIKIIPIHIQNLIAYGTGFLMASYFPYYFYKAFDLTSLRFSAIYGVPIFLILPFLFFFGLLYMVERDLDFALKYGLIIPFFYSFYLLWVIHCGIREKEECSSGSIYRFGKLEMRAIYLAVFPWILLSIFAYFKAPQWIEVLATNTGFVMVTILFLIRSGRYVRKQNERLLMRDEMFEKQRVDFKQNCERYKLTNRESEIAELLCQGITYRQIGETLYIAENTVDAHVQKIFAKTGVNKKIELQGILGFLG